MRFPAPSQYEAGLGDAAEVPVHDFPCPYPLSSASMRATVSLSPVALAALRNPFRDRARRGARSREV